MKKIIILSVSILLVLTVAALALLFFAPTPWNPHSIERTAGFRAKEIVHVRINSGWKSAETEKAEEIQEIVALFRNATARENPDFIPREGNSCGFYLTTRKGESYFLGIEGPGDKISVNGTGYILSSPITYEELQALYKKYEIGTLNIIIREQEQELLEESEETGEDS